MCELCVSEGHTALAIVLYNGPIHYSTVHIHETRVCMLQYVCKDIEYVEYTYGKM
jgi:hypothetical protein